MALCWGICSAGNISSDFTGGLSTLDPSLHSVSAVAARSLERAQKFAELHQIPKAYGNYEELAKDENVDIVYIGSVNNKHLPLCKLFLNHSKHVLCEKPLALNVNEVKEILSLAKKKNLFFMEAVWSRFFPAYQKIREVLSSNHIGEVKLVQASFGFPLLELVDILVQKEFGGGALYNIGMYAVQLALMVFGDEAPSSVSVSGHLLTEGGVDECANITLCYPGNKMAALVYSGVCNLSNEAYIWGTEGHIKVNYPFWCPHQLEVTNTITGKMDQFQFPVPKSRVPVNYDFSTGLRYQAEAVRQAINEGKKEHPLMSHRTSELLATIIEKCRNSLGYVIEGDQCN